MDSVEYNDIADPLKCIVCSAPMENLCYLQPTDGTAFHTTGHYGSSVTDHMDGTVTTVFVCDKCMQDAIDKGVAKVHRG